MHVLMHLSRSCSALALVQCSPAPEIPATCRNHWLHYDLAKVGVEGADRRRIGRACVENASRIARLAGWLGAGLMQSGQASRELMQYPMHLAPVPGLRIGETLETFGAMLCEGSTETCPRAQAVKRVGIGCTRFSRSSPVGRFRLIPLLTGEPPTLGSHAQRGARPVTPVDTPRHDATYLLTTRPGKTRKH
jgi:hypothetical protein